MTDVIFWGSLSAAVLAASVLGGVFGFGTAAVLLPILSLTIGVRAAVPVLGVAMIFANASRAVFSWKEIDWKAALAYSAAAVPMSLIGALLFNGSPGRAINVFLAVAILVLVPLRRIGNHLKIKVKLKHLPWLGGSVGLVTGLGGAVGPAAAPFYLSYGLFKASYLGTDGFNSTLIHSVKCLVYWQGGSMNSHQALLGLAFGGIMVSGSFIGRKLVNHLDANSFTKFVEVFLVVLGGYMLAKALL